MTADGMYMKTIKALVIGASALLAACASDSDDGGLQEGTYAVTGLDLGSCLDATWIKSGTTTTSIVVEAVGDDFVVSACTQDGCSPTSPSRYVWNVDHWTGEDGGAFLAESGCSLLYVNATASLDGDQLVIDADRWASTVTSGSCTLDAVTELMASPCTNRSRLTALQQ